MKKINLKAVVFLFAFILFSCSSDSGSDSECVNIICENGGYFQDCQCNCPDGFIGPDCGTQINPTSVIVTKITVKSFPNTNNGNNWDFASPADMYVNIETQSDILFSSQEYYADAISNGIDFFDFIITGGYQIQDINLPLFITVLDYDMNDTPPSDDEFMASAIFAPYISERGFPETLQISNIEQQVIIELSLQYQWQ